MIKETAPLVDGSIATDVTLTPGQILREARTQNGLTIEEVAARLCLRHSVIEAIEQDDYNNMAGHVFARGYIRAYSRVLQINGDKVIAAFNELGLVESSKDSGTLQPHIATNTAKESPVKWMVLLALFCALALAVLWSQSNKPLKEHNEHAAVNGSVVKQKELALPKANLSELETVPHTEKLLPEALKADEKALRKRVKA